MKRAGFLLAFMIPATICYGQGAPVVAPAAAPGVAPAVPPAAEPAALQDTPLEGVKPAAPTAGLAVDGSYVIGASDVIKPQATVDAIVPGFLYFAAWMAVCGCAFLFFGFETGRQSLTEIDAELGDPAVETGVRQGAD